MNLQEQGEETEDIVVGVRSFYHLYELCINYSLGINKIKSRITDDSPLKAPEQEESKDSDFNKLAQTMPAHQIDKLMNQRPTRRNTTLDEEHLCSICFEKQIQLVLPCLVSEQKESEKQIRDSYNFYIFLFKSIFCDYYFLNINNSPILNLFSMVFVRIVAMVGTLKRKKQNVPCVELQLVRGIGIKKSLQLLVKVTPRKLKMKL